MKIRYLDGSRLYHAFLAGGRAVIRDRDYLNKINVFPVPDADTGTNLASTMRAIAERARSFRSAHHTLSSIADAALTGARGNSGIIFAQFVYGLSREVRSEVRLSTRHFAESVRRAVRYARESIISPVEGTMLTLIHDWAEAMYEQRLKMGDFAELLSYSLHTAERSLKSTTGKLEVLRQAGVVDAGAKGFFDFLEGVAAFIGKGDLKGVLKDAADLPDFPDPVDVHAGKTSVTRRFCLEALLVGSNIDVGAVRAAVRAAGESAIVAGSPSKLRLHVHSDNPADLFQGLRAHGSVVEIKADDMLRQFQAAHQRLAPVALLTDSTCDLPQDVLDAFQIHVVPFSMSFGDSLFLDKVTISPEQFYGLLRSSRDMPKSSQPAQAQVQRQLEFLAGHYDAVLAVAISGRLTGLHGQLVKAREALPGARIAVVDSRHLSVSLALIVLRAAEAVAAGRMFDEVARAAETWAGRTRLWVDIKTLKYMVRGGRVSPAKGLLAALLNIKPIISLDTEGRAEALGKSFSRRGNMKKILRMIRGETGGRRVWNYAIVHAGNPLRALRYADEIGGFLGKKPAFISDVSPAVAVHNGLGVVGIAVMFE